MEQTRSVETRGSERVVDDETKNEKNKKMNGLENDDSLTKEETRVNKWVNVYARVYVPVVE